MRLSQQLSGSVQLDWSPLMLTDKPVTTSKGPSLHRKSGPLGGHTAAKIVSHVYNISYSSLLATAGLPYSLKASPTDSSLSLRQPATLEWRSFTIRSHYTMSPNLFALHPHRLVRRRRLGTYDSDMPDLRSWMDSNTMAALGERSVLGQCCRIHRPAIQKLWDGLFFGWNNGVWGAD